MSSVHAALAGIVNHVCFHLVISKEKFILYRAVIEL